MKKIPGEEKNAASEFSEARSRSNRSTLVEIYAFLRESKKWWLAPVIIVILLFGLLIILSHSAAAPFIYTLF